jgi:hypothetical protein
MLETVCSSETSLNIYKTNNKRYNIPRDECFHNGRRENLKSHVIKTQGLSPNEIRVDVLILLKTEC